MRGSDVLRLLLPWLVALAVLALLPLFSPSRTMFTLLHAMGINVVFALAYNMLLGQGGMLSFGHAVYFGLGGYAALHMMNWIEAAELPFPVFGLPIIGFAGGLLAGAVIGWPTTRRAGVPFAMITLGIGELVAAAGLMFVTIFGGEEGIAGDRMVGPELFGLSLGPIREVYWFIAAWTLIAAALMYAFTRTPLGRLSNAVRDNPQRVAFVGYDPTRVRYLVFMISSGFAGLAGGMSAVNYEILTPETFGAVASGTVLLMTFIGGAMVFYGPILGACLLTLMQSMLSDYTEAWQLYVGLLFMAMVAFAPGGLGGMVERARLAAARGELAEQAPVWTVGTLGIVLTAAGLAMLVELTFHWREGMGAVHFFGWTLETDGAGSWVTGAAILALGVVLVRAAPTAGPMLRARMAREMS